MTATMTQSLGISGRVLLVGWDAADWKIISPMLDRGEMPHLARLIDRGAMGDLLTLQPALSPMLWNSIATGHWPERHGVHGFTEVDPVTNTVRSVGSTSRNCKALWNIVTQTGGRAHVVNWYASHPAEAIRGICVTDALRREHSTANVPAPTGAVHPAEMLAEFADLCMLPDEIDEQTLHLFVPKFALVDQDADDRLIKIARLLAESFSVHNQATRVVADHPWDLAAVYYPGIDHFCHGFVNYHPPQQGGISDADFEIYSEVVSGAYRLHDLFLGRLIRLAGPETTVVLLSDHGFHSDHLRPKHIPHDPVGPTVQHRDHGVLVIAGPETVKDERIYGAGLLDIAPTVLTLLGLPVGRDMPGRVLVDAFAGEPEVCRISSWEDVDGDSGMHPRGFIAPSRDQSLVLEHFAALGYLDAEEMQGAVGPDACRRENRWHLAQSLLYAGETQRGADLLLELCQEWPDRRWYAIELAEALRRMRLCGEASQLIEALVAHHSDTSAARYLLGIARMSENNHAAAIELLQGVSEEYADVVGLRLGLGRAYLRLGDPEAAEREFRRATEIDPHDAKPRLGLARCALRRKDWHAAAQHAMQAIGLEFMFPQAHAVLGFARLRQGDCEEALLSLRVASHQAPNWRVPQRLIAAHYPGLVDDHAHERDKVARPVHRRCYLNVARRKSLEVLISLYRERKPKESGPAEPPAEAFERHHMTVVSGLPRSGTSVMMQMLKSGGAPVLTDDVRRADIDNPHGYLEWEPIKQLPQHPEVLCQAQGKAVKIISSLLYYLPIWHRYDVVFLDRPIDEIIASQLKMRERRNGATVTEKEQLRAALLNHRDIALDSLRKACNVRLLVVPYHELVADPLRWSERVADFLRNRVRLDASAMASMVRSDLHRNRTAANAPLAHHLSK